MVAGEAMTVECNLFSTSVFPGLQRLKRRKDSWKWVKSEEGIYRVETAAEDIKTRKYWWSRYVEKKPALVFFWGGFFYTSCLCSQLYYLYMNGRILWKIEKFFWLWELYSHFPVRALIDVDYTLRKGDPCMLERTERGTTLIVLPASRWRRPDHPLWKTHTGKKLTACTSVGNKHSLSGDQSLWKSVGGWKHLYWKGAYGFWQDRLEDDQ